MDGYRDFTFDPQKFASLPSLVEDLHKHGQHYVMILVLASLMLRAVTLRSWAWRLQGRDWGQLMAPSGAWVVLASSRTGDFCQRAICLWKSPVRAGSAEIRARLLHYAPIY